LRVNQAATDGESWEHRLALNAPLPDFDAAFSEPGASPSMMFRSFRLCVGSLIAGYLMLFIVGF
jgi:hypothetical protein